MAFVSGAGAEQAMLWESVSNRDLPEVQRLLAKGGNPNMLCPDNIVGSWGNASEKFRAGQVRHVPVFPCVFRAFPSPFRTSFRTSSGDEHGAGAAPPRTFNPRNTR